MLKDQAARDIISQAMELNLMVEAGAGSGKTEEMSKRILALVSRGYRRISEIVAITFTRKAANELRERVRAMLQREYAKTNNELHKKALDHIHECFIGTIHAFCAKLLRERPIEAGIDPRFEQIDEAKDHFTRQKIWEEYVLTAGDEENRLLKLMDILDVRESAARNFLKTVCDNQDVNFALPNEPSPSFDSIMARGREAVSKLSSKVLAHYGDIPEAVISGLADGDGMQKSIIKFRDKLRGSQIEDLSEGELIRLLSMFSTKNSISLTQKRWGESKEDKANAKDIGNAFSEIRESEVVPILGELNTFVYNSVLLPFAMKAKELYAKHKHTVAELNYQDLLIKSSDMLRDFPDVRRYFQNRYKTLLIDEFQDTDPIQVGMTMYLVGEELEEKRWNMITPKEGSLFVVGDPKQSIYGFRRADFTMYKRFKAHMEKMGGRIIELHTNFRAVSSLGGWYNTVFPNLLKNEEQASYSQMEAVVPVLEDTLAGVAHYRVEEKKVADIIEKEAENLTHIIRHIVGRKSITVRDGTDSAGNPKFKSAFIRYKDIMVLTMKKRQLEAIGNSIAKQGIPVKITGADITKQTSEFVSFRDLIRMLAYPEENAYIHNVMNGDFFCITDREIYDFRRLGGEHNIYFDFKAHYENNALNDDDCNTFEKIRACFGKLRRFLDYVKTLSPAAATERIIEELDIMRAHLTSDEKMAGFGSFVSLIEKIRLKKITDIWGLELFINELAMMIENGFEENLDIEGTDFNAVRVMNTHKAKGLEAPVVILCAPCSGGLPAPSFYTECVPDEQSRDCYYGYAKVNKTPDYGFAHQFFEPAGWAGVAEKAKKKEELERERLLYVAATRAKNLLVISGSAAKDNPWSRLISWLPAGTANMLDDVYSEEPDALEPEAKKAADETETAKTLSEIKAKRDEAFNHNQPTFGIFAPSDQTKKIRIEDDEGISHELEKTIRENTMEVIIDGDESQIKADRLEIGTVVHKLLETLIKNESMLPDTIGALIEKDKDEYITKEFLEGIVEKFKERKLYGRIRKSTAVYTEVPFSFKVPAGASYAGNTFAQDTYVNGIIDLVFKESGKWVIIDYKTYADTEASHDLRKMYEPQLDAYKDVWESITGEAVGEAEIFFVLKRVAG